jgi:hypothetical protein
MIQLIYDKSLRIEIAAHYETISQLIWANSILKKYKRM